MLVEQKFYSGKGTNLGSEDTEEIKKIDIQGQFGEPVQ